MPSRKSARKTTGDLPRSDSKTCLSCGRRITWRKKWERDWDDVRYCSTGCRKSGVAAVDTELEDRILRLLDSRSRSSSICPSDVAREKSPDDWRPFMEPVRRAARRLVADGRVEITQGGHVVDPSTAKGPIRIRLAR